MRDVVRASVVCGRWRTLSTSPAFRSSWSRVVRPEDLYLPFLAASSQPTVCLAFNPSSQRWLSMPDLRFLAGSVTVRCTSTGVFESAHNGLFCKWNYLSKGRLPKLVVFNPVTKVCRTLPSLETERNGKRPEYSATHLRVDDDSRNYNVTVVESGAFLNVRVCNYESKSDSWTVWSSCNTGEPALLSYANSVYRGGIIYCVTRNVRDLDYGDAPYYSLFMYHVVEREWKHLCELPDDEKIPMLVECASGIMVVTCNERIFRKGLIVYSVDSTLIELGQAPDEFDHFRRLFHREYQSSYLHPVGLWNLICFPTIESKQALIYDTEVDTWGYWPSGPYSWPDRPQDFQSAPPIPPLRFPVSLSFVDP